MSNIGKSKCGRGVGKRVKRGRKSCVVGTVFSEMAGPNYVKLSGIDEGNSEHVFGQKKNWVIIVIKDVSF